MIWYRLSVVLLAGTLLMALGCGGGGGGSTPTQAVTQAPATLVYPINPGNYTKGTAIAPNLPTVGGGAVTAFSVSPALPAGLNLNTVNGLISGTPTIAMPSANYVVTASNSGGSTTTTLTITVIDSSVLPPTGLVYSTNPALYLQGVGITPNMPTVSGGGRNFLQSQSESSGRPGIESSFRGHHRNSHNGRSIGCLSCDGFKSWRQHHNRPNYFSHCPASHIQFHSQSWQHFSGSE